MEDANLFRETATRIMDDAKFQLRQWEFSDQCSVDNTIGFENTSLT